MKISHIKETTDEVTSEYLKIEYKDVRYSELTQIMYISIAEANLLSAELNKKLVSIPF